jgi:hypothetical protein
MRNRKSIHNNQRKRTLNRNKMRIANRRHMQFTLEQYALKASISE